MSGAPTTIDALAMLLGRSPGERVGEHLASIKAKKEEVLENEARSDKVLGKIFPSSSLESPGFLPSTPFATSSDLLVDQPVFQDQLSTNLLNTYGGPADVQQFAPAMAAGGNYGVAPPIGIPSPAAAVPEPGTWALMLMGFALCGAALRRRPYASSNSLTGRP